MYHFPGIAASDLRNAIQDAGTRWGSSVGFRSRGYVWPAALEISEVQGNASPGQSLPHQVADASTFAGCIGEPRWFEFSVQGLGRARV